MRYRNLSESTQRIYSGAVRELVAYLSAEQGAPAPGTVTRRQIEAFVAHRLAIRKPGTASAEFRALQQFCVASGSSAETVIAVMQFGSSASVRDGRTR